MAALLSVFCLLSLAGPASAAPLTGAIFTTDSTCSGVDLNIYASQGDVYLNGGPARAGAAGLPDGSYYVQVTTPDGDMLGTSVGSANQTPVSVAGGVFAQCYQLSAILIKASDRSAGYDTTTNPGGVYKVWVSTDPGFAPSASKTDNFKVNASPTTPPPPARLNVIKYYDANANGVQDAVEVELTGWKINVRNGINLDRFTPFSIFVAHGEYVVSEYMPIETNWVATDPATGTSKTVVVAAGATENVAFGNVCLGAGGGRTIGFWSNKNGQALFDEGDRLALVALNLVNATGTPFNPASYTAFRTWLLNANATNMAYMLSAQLAAMTLNVREGLVSGSARVYSPELGFQRIDDLMLMADAALASHPNTVAGSTERAAQENLKNALDAANNNLNFVQAAACPYTFAP